MMIPTFAVDVMCIKPFDEGTGRLARLFSLLLMEKAGFDVGRYVSIDRLCERHAAAYYEALYGVSAQMRVVGNPLAFPRLRDDSPKTCKDSLARIVSLSKAETIEEATVLRNLFFRRGKFGRHCI